MCVCVCVCVMGDIIAAHLHPLAQGQLKIRDEACRRDKTGEKCHIQGIQWPEILLPLMYTHDSLS